MMHRLNSNTNILPIKYLRKINKLLKRFHSSGWLSIGCQTTTFHRYICILQDEEAVCGLYKSKWSA